MLRYRKRQALSFIALFQCRAGPEPLGRKQQAGQKTQKRPRCGWSEPGETAVEEHIIAATAKRMVRNVPGKATLQMPIRWPGTRPLAEPSKLMQVYDKCYTKLLWRDVFLCSCGLWNLYLELISVPSKVQSALLIFASCTPQEATRRTALNNCYGFCSDSKQAVAHDCIPDCSNEAPGMCQR